MKKILIIQPSEIISNEMLQKLADYTYESINKTNILILNKNTTYEIVEISE